MFFQSPTSTSCYVDFGVNLAYSVFVSLIGFYFSIRYIPRYGENLYRANIQSKDMNKSGQRMLPEGLGIVTTNIFVICVIIFMPFAFIKKDTGLSFIVSFLDLRLDLIFNRFLAHGGLFDFETSDFIQFTCAILSITFISLVGFADDVVRLNWKQKFFLSATASLPLLMVYYTIIGGTTIVFPNFLQSIFGITSLRLGVFYYLFLVGTTVFYSNVINILSGINGVETGESIVISCSIVIINFIETYGKCATKHMISIYFLTPFIATSLGLLRYNWYPATIYVGRTYCYVAGMTFATSAILGQFNNTLLFLFLPQALNLMYSLPQILGWLPSTTKSRLPRYNHNTQYVEVSMVNYFMSNSTLPWFLKLFKFFRLAVIKPSSDGNPNEILFNNLTLSNFILMKTGPLEEKTLAWIIIGIQFVNSLCVLWIRYNFWPLG